MKSIYRANLYLRMLLVIFIAGSLLLQLLFAAMPGTIPHWIKALSQYLLLFGLPSLIFARMYGLQRTDVGLKVPLHLPVSLPAAFALAFLMQPPLVLISALTSMVFPNPVEASMQTILKDPLPLALLSSAVLPAFFEELACRGFFLSDYADRKPVIAALMSGLAFAMLHMNFQQFPYAFVFGCCISFLALYTRSVYLPMLTHMLINASQLLMARLNVDFPGSILTLFLISLPCSLLIFLLLRFLRNKAPKSGYRTSFTFSEIEPLLHAALLFIACAVVLR